MIAGITGTGDVRKVEKKRRKVSRFEAYDNTLMGPYKIDIAIVVVDALGTGTDKLPKWLGKIETNSMLQKIVLFGKILSI